MADIGKRIKAKRESLGLTQEELAHKLGYKNKTSIAKIEIGANDITQSKVIEFAKALNTTPSYLMGWEWDVVNMDLSAIESNVITAYRNNPDKQHAINMYLGIQDKPDNPDSQGYKKIQTEIENDLYNKYLSLDSHGKELVDLIINKEHERTSDKNSQLIEKYLSLDDYFRDMVDNILNHKYDDTLRYPKVAQTRKPYKLN